jgi:uncharacterized protein
MNKDLETLTQNLQESKIVKRYLYPDMLFHEARTPEHGYCLDIAARRAEDLGIEKILIATCTGKTALKALDYFDLKKHRMIAVSHVTGFIRPNEQEMPEQVRDDLVAKGFTVLTGAHAFGGIGRGVRNKLNTYQVDEIMAFTLRMLGQGSKVGVEIALMCADAGLVRTDEDVLTLAGSGRGCDTALIINLLMPTPVLTSE